MSRRLNGPVKRQSKVMLVVNTLSDMLTAAAKESNRILPRRLNGFAKQQSKVTHMLNVGSEMLIVLAEGLNKIMQKQQNGMAGPLNKVWTQVKTISDGPNGKGVERDYTSV